MQRKEKLNIPPISITIILIIIQLFFIVLIHGFLIEYQNIYNISWHIISVIVAIFMISRENENSAYKMAWIVIMCTFPLFALILYFIIKILPGTNIISATMEEKIKISKKYIYQNENNIKEFENIEPNYVGLVNSLYKKNLFPIYKNNKIEYFSLGELAFESIREELLKAEKYIFIEFFIISVGTMLDELLDILEQKARQGVEVRFMYDGSNMFSLAKNYHNEILRRGINCKVFSPVRAVISSYQNNRDHRKIIVIDGKVGFTGGINIADEYINRKVRFGHWKDCMVKITGNSVNTIQAMFLQMWSDSKTIKEEYDRYLYETNIVEEKTKNFVIPYGDYPDNKDDNPAQEIYIHILFYAKKYVYIMTPYLILNDEMIMAMKYASNRGVDVKLILPEIPDKKIPYMVAQSYFSTLINSGVEIYKYIGGFVHSKVFLSDDTVSTVGTVNLDYRSLYLHFENGVFFYDRDLAKTIKRDFDDTIKKSKLITIEDVKNINILKKLTMRILRVFAPIM